MGHEAGTFHINLPKGLQHLQDTSPADRVQFLLFQTGGLRFGANVDHVVEIIANPVISPLPLVPEYVRGLIQVRGRIIPVIDTRSILQAPGQSPSCTIIINADGRYLGLLVDAATQIVTVSKDDIQQISDENPQVLALEYCMLSNGSTMYLLDNAQLFPSL